MRSRLAWLALLALLGCDRPVPTFGAACSLNTDCASPLVCRLQRCRRQCLDSRDCGAGLRCLYIDPSEESGVCQLEEEAECTLASECTDGLVCRFGTCTTECATNRDCPPAATCRSDDGAPLACVEPATELCVYNSDCPAPLVCGPDQLCRLECREMRDCRPPRECIDSICQLPDGG